MNFDEAVSAHSEWKVKLALYLRLRDGSLNPVDIQPDNRCELGKWIYGEGTKFSAMPKYRALVQEHARFHQAAADVVRRSDDGESVTDELVLGSASEFAKASLAVVRALMAMKKKA